MVFEKQMVVKLFLNIATNTFYIQLGEEMLFKINDKVCTAIQLKEKIEIVHVRNLAQIQNKED